MTKLEYVVLGMAHPLDDPPPIGLIVVLVIAQLALFSMLCWLLPEAKE